MVHSFKTNKHKVVMILLIFFFKISLMYIIQKTFKNINSYMIFIPFNIFPSFIYTTEIL